jgi:rare lipoprotein A
MPRPVTVAAFCLMTLLAGCASRAPSTAAGARTRALETRVGLASFYGREFHGKTTASGARFDMNAMVAAHPSYPFGTRLRVVNLANGRSATVRVVDRGPSQELRAAGLIIDVSRRAAEVLQFVRQGRTRVRVEVLAWGNR